MDAPRVGWAVAGLFVAAILVYECIKHGIPAVIAAVIFLAVPWVPWWPLRLPWVPLAAVVVYTFEPFHWPPFYTAGLAWLTGIAAVRVVHGARVMRPTRS
ncbi:hypothetical protein ACTI_56910 [Actinoplanes sp. OR16]|uniref:hypothetical protein n=1 Tax=Actinoplanes sp. OR16 TaxID=946334 RepID=UPI000F6D8F19|nr:hypothetical protein [Actinoplanes sp. OR16]BBH69006.1 hypothetical protein ACTI_56910 [Actinoplanes sp. OR16]